MSINLEKGKVEWVENQFLPYSEEAGDEFIGRCQVQLTGATVRPLAINGGAARIAIAANDTDAAQIYGPGFEVDEATLVTMRCRLRITDVSVASVYIGLTDQVTANEVPIEDEDGTLATNATDAAGILLEGEQDETWQTVGVDTDVDKAQTAIGAGTNDVTLPDATDNNWHTWVLEFTAADSGTMKVYGEDANGQLVLAATRTSFFDSSIAALYPVISADARNAAYNVDVAEFAWTGGVGSVFD